MQKTAYEMRISDWSSDVCSSDLALVAHRHAVDHRRGVGRRAGNAEHDGGERAAGADHGVDRQQEGEPRHRLHAVDEGQQGGERAEARSEKATSELPSLMPISYVGFCLEKKTTSTYTLLTPHN